MTNEQLIEKAAKVAAYKASAAIERVFPRVMDDINRQGEAFNEPTVGVSINMRIDVWRMSDGRIGVKIAKLAWPMKVVHEDEEADAETIVDGRQLELPEMGPPEKTGEGQ